ncbi:MAG TPA: DinB family protein, partial [Thermodesulfobacteriota bacterium]
MTAHAASPPSAPIVFPTAAPDREHAIEAFTAARRRTAALFDLVVPDAYLARPLPLRQPIAFYEGHVAALAVNTLLKKALGRPGIDARFETLFARGIDPADESSAARSAAQRWPSREEIHGYAERADAALLDVLASIDLEADDETGARVRQALQTSLEH